MKIQLEKTICYRFISFEFAPQAIQYPCDSNGEAVLLPLTCSDVSHSLTALFHFESKEGSLRTAWCRCVVSLVFVELIAAFIQCVNLSLAFLLLMVVLGQTVCVSHGQSFIPALSMMFAYSEWRTRRGARC
jgi:hypothetical protein